MFSVFIIGYLSLISGVFKPLGVNLKKILY